MSIEEKITNLIEPALTNLNYELVRVKQVGDDVMQIMIDSPNGINIEDCTKATKLIRNILQVAEMANSYGLEISSPGLDRPLLKPEHFKRFINHDIKVKTNIQIDGRKKFVGKLIEFDSETQSIKLVSENNTVTIELNHLQSANLYYK